MGNQMPFLYPHSFVPPITGLGFTAPAHAAPSATIDLTEGSQKRGAKVSATDHTMSKKKRRVPRKKTEIIDLDDATDNVDVSKVLLHFFSLPLFWLLLV